MRGTRVCDAHLRPSAHAIASGIFVCAFFYFPFFFFRLPNCLDVVAVAVVFVAHRVDQLFRVHLLLLLLVTFCGFCVLFFIIAVFVFDHCFLFSILCLFLPFLITSVTISSIPYGFVCVCVFDVSRALFWLFFVSVINRICQPKCWCCLYYVPAYNNVPCNFDFFLDFVVLHFEPACIQICSLPFLLPFDLLSNTYGTVCTVLAIFYADFELFSC